jgi:DNA-binding NarL/FixJ family response regulator
MRESVEVVAVVSDLMFASRIRAAAASAGVSLRLARGSEELGTRAPSPTLVLVDAELRTGSAADTIRRLKALPEPPHIVAFASHTNATAIQAAREAGADRVLARSAFVRDLPSILEALAR